MMKNLKKILLPLFLITAINSYSQSISIYGGMPYYFIDNQNYNADPKTSNNFNYQFGIAGTKYFENFSLEIGYKHSTKNFKFDFSSAGKNLQSIEIASNINSIPVIFSPKLFSNKRNIYSLVTGVDILKTGKYSEKTIYKGGKTIENNGSRFDFRFGMSAILGMKYTRVIKNNFLFFTSFNANYKFVEDYESNSPINTPSEDKFLLNLNLGVELLLFDEIKYFRWNKAKGKFGF